MFYVSNEKWLKVAEKKDILCAHCFLEKSGGQNWYFVRVPGQRVIESIEDYIEKGFSEKILQNME